MFEQRRNVRLSMNIPVLIFFKDLLPLEGWGRILNISFGGVEFETRHIVKEQDTIYLTFSISNVFHFRNIRSKVVRTKFYDGHYISGVKFEELTDQEHLKDAIKYCVEH